MSLTRAFGLIARPLFAVLAGRTSLGILMYHRVLERPDPLQPLQMHRDAFELQMRLLSESFTPLRLDAALIALKGGTLPPRAVAVTFDDGYADNLHVALPVMQRRSVPATIFVTSGFVDGGPMWNDVVVEKVRRIPAGDHEFAFLAPGRRHIASDHDRHKLVREMLMNLKYRPAPERDELVANLPAPPQRAPLPRLMLTAAELRKLHESGVEIGAHTVSHPILAKVSEEVAQREMDEGRAQLSQLLGTQVRGFAYPNGRPVRDYDERHPQLARRLGFDYAVSTAWGVTRAAPDMFQLPRMAYVPCSELQFMRRMVSSYAQAQAETV